MYWVCKISALLIILVPLAGGTVFKWKGQERIGAIEVVDFSMLKDPFN